MSKLDAALEAARRGFDVFPLVPNSKVPAVDAWPYWATRDEGKIRDYWGRQPDCNIGGALAGKGAVDIDLRKGGDKTFLPLAAELELSKEDNKTLLTETASGGNHFVYALPPGIRLKSRNDQFGRGIDLKSGPGAYLVMPGSTIDGNAYKWVNDRPIRQMLPGLVERAQFAVARSPDAGKRLVEEDDWAVERAEAWVLAAAAAEQGDRDNSAFRVAAKLYDFGVSAETVLDLLAAWNDEKCAPPLDIDALRRIASSAGRNRAKPIGVSHPDNATGFEPKEIKPSPFGADGFAEPPPKRRKFYSIQADESAEKALIQPKEWLVENVMFRGDEAALIGAPGGGKTFFALDMAYHIATGTQFGGNATFHGPVVYIAAEAQWGINNRMAALRARYGSLARVPLWVIPVAPDLAHGLGDAKALIEEINRLADECGEGVELFVVDTLNRAIAGGDENNPKDMGSFLNAIREIRTATDAASLVVHHPGKDESRGGRGHSSAFGAVDVELRISGKVMRVHKLRDGEEGHQIAFQVKPISIGCDTKGRRVTSCYVQCGQVGEIQTQLSGAEREVYEAIKANAKLDAPFDTETVVRWAEASTKIDGRRSTKKKTIWKHIHHVYQKGWIKEVQPGQWVMLPSTAST